MKNVQYKILRVIVLLGNFDIKIDENITPWIILEKPLIKEYGKKWRR